MEANIAFVAGLPADPTRAAMCLALAGGAARPAGEVTAGSRVSAHTASQHWSKLIAGHIARRLRDARICYSHLAGRLSVTLADALISARWPEEGSSRARRE
jgi:hypothetical protein